MPTLLHIDSSPLTETSISRQLTAEFVRQWQRANVDGRILRRDLTKTHLPVITGEWITASSTPEVSRTAAQRDILQLSDTLISDLEAADEYIIGVPMHNFTVSAATRLWIDQIVRVGKTFAYVDGVRIGMLENKRATFMIASGGVYDSGTPAASFDFVAPYLRAIFGFIGVTDVHVHSAGGVAAVRFSQLDERVFLQPHLEAIRSQFVPA